MLTPLHLRVFLASPGDVSIERALANQVLERLPYDPLLRGRVTVEAVAWDKPDAGTPMLATMTPQAAIALGRPKPSDCHIVIVIFWSRMGTPLPRPDYCKADGSAFLSGTEWEFFNALDAAESVGRPEILVYRRTERLLLDPDDPQFDEKVRQRRQVEEFFATFRNEDGSIRRGYNEFPTPDAFREKLDSDLREVLARLLPPPREAAPASVKAEAPVTPVQFHGSPFPGLRAFTPDDAPIFFGRGRETDEFLRRLSDNSSRFLVVVGASGSGKSSLVAAGVLPRLKDNAVVGAKDWLLPHVLSAAVGERKQWAGLRFTPGEVGDNPFQSLALKLAPLLPDESLNPRKVAEKLESRPDALVELAATALGTLPTWAEALLFIDQFEELFTVVAERFRVPFIDLLATSSLTPRLRIVATLRSDFYHHCVEFPPLAEMLRSGSFPLAAPRVGALLEMITGPAARAGLHFNEHLPARILDETGTDPGGLALLAFALHELYKARTSAGELTDAAYDSFGGVRRAIGRCAEEAFSHLPVASQALLGVAFRELIDVDERGLATKRRVPRQRLPSSDEFRRLLDTFIDARLLMTDRGPDRCAVLEIAHEALLREWPRLAEWIVGREDDMRFRRYLEVAAREWQRSGCDPSHLWPNERLTPVYEALDRLGLARDGLDEPIKSFLRPEAGRLVEELGLAETSHFRRLEIGDRLEQIGDSRAGVGLRPDGLPDILWCEIPGGMVAIESAKDSFQVQHFFMAKYPVTYRQFIAFLLDPNGHANKDWWDGLKRLVDPWRYQRTSNRPVEKISWYDAVAYCRWLSHRLGYEVRLPTEPEWQQAATGGRPECAYPWGSAWVDGHANTEESSLNRSTAVGMYPRGASDKQVLDLAGNVMEWCLDAYDPAQNWKNSPRVVRGGAWNLNAERARCKYRFGVHPDDRFLSIGIRVVCVSPIF